MKYGILIYDGVEPIDLGATFGVLSMARRIEPAIQMAGVAGSSGVVTCANGLQVFANHGFGDAPEFDALIVTGGPGWRDAAADADTLAYLRAIPRRTFLASICTGAMILAAAGRLDGHAATTKVEVTGAERPPIDVLTETYPAVRPRVSVAVRSGDLLTSGGVSLGIDGVLYLLSLMHGEQLALETARIMEYGRALKANAEGLPPVGLPALHWDYAA